MASMYLAARQARQQNDTLSSSISNGTDSGLDPDALAAMQDGTIRVQQLIESVGLVAWDMSRRESLNQGCVTNCTSASTSDMAPPPPPPPTPVPVCDLGGGVKDGGGKIGFGLGGCRMEVARLDLGGGVKDGGGKFGFGLRGEGWRQQDWIWMVPPHPIPGQGQRWPAQCVSPSPSLLS